ncbi:MAG: ATP-binding protein [Bdellovibrionales bacterium]|jgi:two-component system nitrogen regulation sensor histidine kinase NtrY|nr:ATP-binding protein [Bdellovibrionales bacterium]
MLIPQLAPKEFRKRKREIALIVGLLVLFVVLTLVEIKLVGISQQLPFVHSIFFFGLVNFNIILLLLLFFLIFRNVVKVFVESSGRGLGSSLKGKLIAAFVAFASVPTALMFLVSVFYINSSFDKWFSVRMASVLRNSLEVNQEYVFSAKKKNFHFAKLIAAEIQKDAGRPVTRLVESSRTRFNLDSVEYYPGLFAARVVSLSNDESIPPIPPVSLEFLKNGVTSRAESSTIHHFGEGNLVRVIVPVDRKKERGALVVSTFIPISLISKIDDISAAHEEFRNVNPLEYPIKSIYLVILSLMTLVILLCATWFGFHLARELSIPLELLGSATRRIARGDYQQVGILSGSKEVNSLVASFNQMVGHLDRSKREVLEANRNLTTTLEQLDEHSRYVQVVLAHVTTGVVSVDQEERITTINQHAAQLLQIDPVDYVGRLLKDVLPNEYLTIFQELLVQMRSHGFVNFQRELRIEIKGRTMPLQMNLALLQDEKGQELGKVLVFDDLTMLLNAQRAAAWTEVARRIAHEIKNPLTPIKLSAQRLEKKFGDQIQDPAFSSCIGMIIRQTDDLKRLVNEFSNFARLPQTRAVHASLKTVVEEAVAVFNEAHRDIQLVVEQDGALPEFLFDPDQMKRVLINLLDNAVAAVEGVAEPRILIRTQYDSLLKLVRVSVNDNGVGISPENRDRVFEPYFSTKESGTGLGLAIVRRIVEDHNGFIRALPNEPQGTRILVELPVAEVDISPFEETRSR